MQTSTALGTATQLLLELTLAVGSACACLVVLMMPARGMGALSNMAVVWLAAGPVFVIALIRLRRTFDVHARIAGSSLLLQLGLMSFAGLATVNGFAVALGILGGPGDSGLAGPMAVVGLVGMGVYVIVGAWIISSARRADAAGPGRR